MKKALLMAALAVGTITSVMAATPVVEAKTGNTFLSNPNFTITKELKISENFRALNINVKVMGQKGVEIRPVKAFAGIIDGKEYVMTGTVYTPEGTVLKVPLNKKVLDEGTAWTFGEGSEELYLVTNPSCSWCAKLEKQLHDGTNEEFFKKYKVSVILMPFGGGAIEKTKWVLSAKTDAERAKRYKSIMIDGDSSWNSFKPTNDIELDAEIQKTNAAAKELGATGTPALFTSDFDQIKNWPTLLSK